MSEKLLYVVWQDAVHCSGDGWIDKQEYVPDKTHVESVGFLVYEDDDCVVLAGSNYETHFASEILIPKKMIFDQQVLRESTKDDNVAD